MSRFNEVENRQKDMRSIGILEQSEADLSAVIQMIVFMEKNAPLKKAALEQVCLCALFSSADSS